MPNISKWNIKNVSDISEIFSNCSSLISIPDISNLNTINVIKINDLFNNCLELTSIPDISKWKFNNNIIEMSNLFNGCKTLISIPDISKWNIENINKNDIISNNYESQTFSFESNSNISSETNNIRNIY